jgi:hypothetical protein
LVAGSLVVVGKASPEVASELTPELGRHRGEETVAETAFHLDLGLALDRDHLEAPYWEEEMACLVLEAFHDPSSEEEKASHALVGSPGEGSLVVRQEEGTGSWDYLDRPRCMRQ